ncbi:glutamine amidotransferase [Georgenia subflava]|uniref:Glutamine amidotransferase n=1 Tax=Georgenia subflava TaxID=1622177 RepID=A0A6N7EKA7_9MICO|nr:glutamine amidotransferase [Georgenia subflava]MPV37237.1 glutamine amidotransferase [Georgenia subflava]
MTAKPFALLASRSEDVAADDEYASFLRLSGLAPEQLVRIRMEAGRFTPLDLDSYAGILLGGSPFTVSTPEEHKSNVQRRVEAELSTVLAEIHRRDLPFLGLCYGVGALGRLTGAVVDGTHAEETAAVRIELTGEGVRDPLLADLPPSFDAYVGHKEACTVLPPGAVLLASSAACPVQMFRLGQNQYVTQFHPEMDAQALVTRIQVYRHSGYFPVDEVDAVIDRIARADVSASHEVLRAFVRRYGTGQAGQGARRPERAAALAQG